MSKSRLIARISCALDSIEISWLATISHRSGLFIFSEYFAKPDGDLTLQVFHRMPLPKPNLAFGFSELVVSDKITEQGSINAQLANLEKDKLSVDIDIDCLAVESFSMYFLY